VSEDTTATADLGDAGSRGERRRALQAERERQAQRQAERERQAELEAGERQPEEQAPSAAHPYAVTLPEQEAAVLVSDARQAAESDGAALGPPADAGPEKLRTSVRSGTS